MLRVYIRAVVVSIVVCFGFNGFGQQTIVMDWATHSLVNPTPIEINNVTTVTVEVDNINDYLYSYNGYLTPTGAQVPKLPNRGLAEVECKVQVAIDGMKMSLLNPLPSGSGTPKAIPLQDFENEYLRDKNTIDALTTASSAGCPDAIKKSVDYLLANRQKWSAKYGTKHKYSFQATLEPLTNYQITITETYNGTPTDLKCDPKQATTGTCVIQYNPTNDILSNSQGFLITTLPGYSYARATVPNSTDAVLQVTKSGAARVAAVALFNVRLPWGADWLSHHNFAYGFSLGPVYQLDSSDQAGSRLGFFGGLSTILYKHVVVTPGVHIAQYSRYPTGFTHNGQDIPSTFTQDLTPITKNTVKFGLSITFKDWSIISSKSAGKVTAPSANTPAANTPDAANTPASASAPAEKDQ